ncbi:leucine-rich repeat-containing protein 71 isoform X2 [Lepisosteus oculatus]|uniref:leucine-rich repeat-containing protein 71 isoform X2 n=1 Tax=Lepisosteus oculatus TaxID=7918 RepID=UPI00371C8CDE
MGKKLEKAPKEKIDRGHSGTEDDSSKSTEDYQCTGNLEADFPELCALVGMREIPPVTLRPRTGVTPTTDRSILDNSQSQLDGGGPPPADRFSCLKPRLQVELEGDDPRSVREVRVRGWKVGEQMARVFSRSLPNLSNLQSLHLWRVGLTQRTLTSLRNTLSLCLSLRTVLLEGTPIPEQCYHILIAEDSMLAHLSLRNNQIDEEGARLVGQALSTPRSANKSLLSLNLAFNRIGDAGAQHIAQGLRLNRTLLCLSLAHNHIGDPGASGLAQVLGPFALTHEETVEWRRLMSAQEANQSPRRADSKADRPLSYPSSTSLERGVKTSKSTSKRKDKDPPKKEDKPSALANQTAGGVATGGQGGATGKKEDTKVAKKGSDTKVPRGRGAKSGGKEKRPPVPEQEDKSGSAQNKVVETQEAVCPLLDTVEHREGCVFIPGNHTLTSLTLSGNRLTESCLPAFLSALASQGEAGSTGGTGLLRLSLARNHFSPDCEPFLKIQEVMSIRDPLNKSVPQLPEEEQAQPV